MSAWICGACQLGDHANHHGAARKCQNQGRLTGAHCTCDAFAEPEPAIDLLQVLRDEAALMRTGVFSRTPFIGPHFALADLVERIADRLEGVDVTAGFLAHWEPILAAQDAERKKARR